MPSTKRQRPAARPSAGLAVQLREVIALRGLNAQKVAVAAGINPTIVLRFLSRERGLTLETFDAIAGALGLKLVETARGRGRIRASGQEMASRPEASPVCVPDDSPPEPIDCPLASSGETEGPYQAEIDAEPSPGPVELDPAAPTIVTQPPNPGGFMALFGRSKVASKC